MTSVGPGPTFNLLGISSDPISSHSDDLRIALLPLFAMESGTRSIWKSRSKTHLKVLQPTRRQADLHSLPTRHQRIKVVLFIALRPARLAPRVRLVIIRPQHIPRIRRKDTRRPLMLPTPDPLVVLCRRHRRGLADTSRAACDTAWNVVRGPSIERGGWKGRFLVGRCFPPVHCSRGGRGEEGGLRAGVWGGSPRRSAACESVSARIVRPLLSGLDGFFERYAGYMISLTRRGAVLDSLCIRLKTPQSESVSARAVRRSSRLAEVLSESRLTTRPRAVRICSAIFLDMSAVTRNCASLRAYSMMAVMYSPHASSLISLESPPTASQAAIGCTSMLRLGLSWLATVYPSQLFPLPIAHERLTENSSHLTRMTSNASCSAKPPPLFIPFPSFPNTDRSDPYCSNHGRSSSSASPATVRPKFLLAVDSPGLSAEKTALIPEVRISAGLRDWAPARAV